MCLGKAGPSGEDKHDLGILACWFTPFVEILKSVVGDNDLAQTLEQIGDMDILFRN